MQKDGEILSWYAAKVFYNKTAPIKKILDDEKVKYYIPSDVIPSLLFFYSTEQYARQLRENHYKQMWIYCEKESHRPSIIPQAEMEIFIFVTTAGRQGLIYLGEDKPEYHVGDRVRVIDGPFKGAEGHIKRIKKDRRLIVAVRGVAAVATSYIHPNFLEKADR